jgi:hypothetical protein
VPGRSGDPARYFTGSALVVVEVDLPPCARPLRDGRISALVVQVLIASGPVIADLRAGLGLLDLLAP